MIPRRKWGGTHHPCQGFSGVVADFVVNGDRKIHFVNRARKLDIHRM